MSQMKLITLVMALAACDGCGNTTDGGMTGDMGALPALSLSCPTAADDPVAPNGIMLRVSPSGTDGDCVAAPCKTLQRAAEVATQRGTTVLVDNGSYAGFATVHPGIIFRAGGAEVVIDSGSLSDRINVEETDDVVIEGFKVRNATRAGIRVVTSKNVVVRSNVVSGSGRWGIFTGFADRVRIIGNESFGTNPATRGEHGIYVSNSDSAVDDPVICGNVTHDNHVNGIQINGDCNAGGDGKITGALVMANLVYKNGAKGLSMISAPGVTIVNNVITENGMRNTGAGGIHLTIEPDCPPGDATSNGLIANNTVVEPRIAGLRATDGATANVIFNNILVGRSTAYADETGGNLESANLKMAGASGLAFDAAYRPLAGHPAISAGVMSFSSRNAPVVDIEGAARPQGAAIDQGAFEQ